MAHSHTQTDDDDEQTNELPQISSSRAVNVLHHEFDDVTRKKKEGLTAEGHILWNRADSGKIYIHYPRDENIGEQIMYAMYEWDVECYWSHDETDAVVVEGEPRICEMCGMSMQAGLTIFCGDCQEVVKRQRGDDE